MVTEASFRYNDLIICILDNSERGAAEAIYEFQIVFEILRCVVLILPHWQININNNYII